MITSLFSALFPGLDIQDVELGPEGIVLRAHTTASSATCPRCGAESSHLHSSYTRSPRDLPLTDQPARLLIRVRRFRCRTAACPIVTFVEPVGPLLPPSAQRTLRLQHALQQLGLTLGGAQGARTSRQLHMAASHDTLLRLVRRLPNPSAPTPRVLGVDDFALRKSKTYGTILVDLEQHRPVDLLPERSAAVVEQWLRDHPGVEVIARDRGPEYIRGATAGAPDAIQVADRFHLLTNLRETLERVLERAHAALRARLQAAPPSADTAQANLAVPLRPRRRSSSDTTVRDERRNKRFARYETIRQLHQQGKSKSEIAKELDVSRWLVRRFVEAEAFPEQAPKPSRSTILTPYAALLQERWQAGERSTLRLWQALQAEGYTGSVHTVRHWVQQRRLEPAPHTKPEYRAKYTVEPQQVVPLVAAQRRLPSVRQLAWLLLNNADDLSEDKRQLLDLVRGETSVAAAYNLAQRFVQIVRQRDLGSLDSWLADCSSSGVADFANFASGLQQDGAAVRAALSLSWSSGQVEGQITRLKMLKRQMYGRASFTLLRQRVLHAA